MGAIRVGGERQQARHVPHTKLLGEIITEKKGNILNINTNN